MENIIDLQKIPQVKIRSTRKEDKNEINKLANKLLKHHYEQMPDIFNKCDLAFNDEQFNKIINKEKYYMIVAQIDKEIVGFAYMEYLNKKGDERTKDYKIAYMSMIYVKDKYKQYGIGNKLTKNIIKTAKEKKEKKEIDKIECRIWGFNEASKKMTSKNRNMKLLYSMYELI